jgi:hypothetical protein
MDNENVINTIIADSKEVAEELTGKTCIKFTDEPAEAGGTYVNGSFIKKKPYPSWVQSGSDWVPPVLYPEVDLENPIYYVWDESVVSWVEITPPTESE